MARRSHHPLQGDGFLHSRPMDSEEQRLGQVLEPKQRSRSLESLLTTDTGYDTEKPSRSGSVQSCFNSEETDVLVKQVRKNLMIGKFLII